MREQTNDDKKTNGKAPKGVILPATIFLIVICAAFILILIFRSFERSRSVSSLIKINRGAAMADAGVQVGLARLNYKLSFLPDRVTYGKLVNGNSVYIDDPDLAKYDGGANGKPGMFWTDWMQNIPGDPANFSVDVTSKNASFVISNSSSEVTVILHYANQPIGTLSGARGTSGINDVNLRYTYEVISKDLVSQKVTRVTSYQIEDKTIRIHVSRPLSRYNLFALTNVDRNNQPVWDELSYVGRVYSGGTFYVTKTPTYESSVEISNTLSNQSHWVYMDASSTQWHDTDAGNPFKFHKAAGVGFPVPSPDPTVGEYVDPLTMGISITEASQRVSAQGFNPGPFGLTDVYASTTTMALNSGLTPWTTTSLYVQGDATILIRNPGAGTTTYYDITDANGVFETFEQDVWNWSDPNFLIFVDGNLRVGGQVSNKTKLTIGVGGANHNIIITSSITYPTANNPNTVIGLISWQSDIVVTKNPPAATGNNYILHAVMMTPLGGFGAEGYANIPANYTKGVGTINHTGSIIRGLALPTKGGPAGTLGWGFKSQYDVFLEDAKAPPYFPGNGRYRLIKPQEAKVIDLYQVN